MNDYDDVQEAVTTAEQGLARLKADALIHLHACQWEIGTIVPELRRLYNNKPLTSIDQSNSDAVIMWWKLYTRTVDAVYELADFIGVAAKDNLVLWITTRIPTHIGEWIQQVVDSEVPLKHRLPYEGSK